MCNIYRGYVGETKKVSSIELRKRRKDRKKALFFFLSNCPIKVYTDEIHNEQRIY